MISKRKAFTAMIMLVIFTAFTTFSVSNMIALNIGNKMVISHEMYQKLIEENDNMGKVVQLKHFLMEEYYVELEEEVLIDGAIHGMFEAVGDPYTTYLDAKDMSDMLMSTQGVYGGIGIIVTADEEGYVSVVSPIEDTPGERAGLNTGDRIIRVDDEDVSGNRLDDAVSLMRGDADTEVKLEIMKRNQEEAVEISVVREIIRIQSVRAEVMEDKIGYIRVTNFDEKTASDFQFEMDELTRQGIDRVILDLRNNPGGLLSSAIRMSDLLLDESLIVYTEDRHGNRKEEYASEGNYDVELVVLINEGSASASEILAGALQDHEKAILVGEQSFGKGLVQEMQQLPDGTGFKFTVSEYFTPSGRSIHDKGIKPDHVVEISEEELLESQGQDLELQEDVQLQQAIELLQKR
ncbi:carboxyl-terminal processing protease [Tindallia magadiensis]|uniref:Carboxyl-terminal processing protease n=1 Tax=Tindallia magadiensis TaxID=69895 RepID=A0A1I3F903_9FIRM|nr:S41 family peptidase [Tindallia magadiensis]SFI07321.1 carboxyl-terminal processing protease [Tindallia magadiensis]